MAYHNHNPFLKHFASGTASSCCYTQPPDNSHGNPLLTRAMDHTLRDIAQRSHLQTCKETTNTVEWQHSRKHTVVCHLHTYCTPIPHTPYHTLTHIYIHTYTSTHSCTNMYEYLNTLIQGPVVCFSEVDLTLNKRNSLLPGNTYIVSRGVAGLGSTVTMSPLVSLWASIYTFFGPEI